jgi:methylenetetrahydrofolate reductase (NADPH)
VLRGLQAAPKAATASIAGFHLFPFGGLRKTSRWLRDYPQEAPRQVQAVVSTVGSQNP